VCPSTRGSLACEYTWKPHPKFYPPQVTSTTCRLASVYMRAMMDKSKNLPESFPFSIHNAEPKLTADGKTIPTLGSFDFVETNHADATPADKYRLAHARTELAWIQSQIQQK